MVTLLVPDRRPPGGGLERIPAPVGETEEQDAQRPEVGARRQLRADNRQLQRLLLALLLAVLAFAQTGCATRSVRHSIMRENLIEMDLVRQVRGFSTEKKDYEHPAIISEPRLRNILGALEATWPPASWHARDGWRIAERVRIARDLHDLVIQRLFATGLALQGAARMSARPEVAERIESLHDNVLPHARDLVPLALVALHRGQTQDPSAVQPVYVRDEVSWKKLSEQGKAS